MSDGIEVTDEIADLSARLLNAIRDLSEDVDSWMIFCEEENAQKLLVQFVLAVVREMKK